MESRVFQSKDIEPNKWNAFIEASPEGAVYASFEFLNGILDEWEALIISEGETWQMVFPYKRNSRLFVPYFLQPKFTQYLGPMFRSYDGKKAKELQWKGKLLNVAIEIIRAQFWYANFNISPQSNYTLPFHVKRFRLAPRYTYQIKLSSKTEADLESQILKGKITPRKAEESGLIFQEESSSSEILEAFHKSKGAEVENLAREDYTRYEQTLQNLGSQKSIWSLRSKEGELAGGMILYHYRNELTFAFSYANPEYHSYAVGHALIWKAIRVAQERGAEIFDFEGSMIPAVERVFRRFGAEPVTYLNVQYAKSAIFFRH